MATKPKTKRAKRPSRSKAQQLPQAEPLAQPQPLTLSSGSSPFQKLAELASMVVVLAFGVFLLTHLHCNHSASAPQSAASAPAAAQAGPNWGPEVKLEVADKFKVAGDVWTVAADADGVVYVLTPTGIDRYVAGKKHGGLSFTIPGRNANMAFDGKDFYVVSGVTVQVVPKDLGRVEKKAEVKGAQDFVGVDLASRDRIYISDYTENKIYIVDTNGKIKGYLGDSSPQNGGILAISDISVQGDGSIYTHDQMAAHIDHFGRNEKLVTAMPVPWTDANSTRMAVLRGKIYVTGLTNQRIFLQDLNGNLLGNCAEYSDGSKVQHPFKIGAGKDGFLYVLDDGTVYKLKVATAAPLPTPVPPPKPAKQPSQAQPAKPRAPKHKSAAAPDAAAAAKPAGAAPAEPAPAPPAPAAPAAPAAAPAPAVAAPAAVSGTGQ
jgi:hypothetical protein